MEIIKVTEENGISVIKKSIECGLHRIIHMVSNSSMVFVHKKRQVDEKTCNAMGYSVYEAFHNGGTIVCNKGDFLFAHFGEPENGWIYNFIDYFVNWLKIKGLSVEFIGNDVLVDGHKVCGICITRYGRIDFTCCFISVNTNLDDIKAICKKSMNKIPKSLGEYGITTEEIERMFLDFCLDLK